MKKRPVFPTRGLIFSAEGKRLFHFYFLKPLVEGCGAAFEPELGAPINIWTVSRSDFGEFYYRLPGPAYHFEDVLEKYLRVPGRIRCLQQILGRDREQTIEILERSLGNLERVLPQTLIACWRAYIRFWKRYFWINNICRALDRASRHYALHESPERVKTEDWPALFAQGKKSALDDEQEFFLKQLHKTWGSGRKEMQKAVDAALERYGWMTMSYYNEPPKTSRDYWREINELKTLGLTPLERLRQMGHLRQRVLARREQLYKKIRDKKLRRIIKLIQEATYIKDSLRVYNAKLVYLFEQYFAEIERRTKVRRSVLKQLFPQEVEELMRRGVKPSREAIRKRANWHVAGLVNGRFAIWYGQEAERLVKRCFRPQKSGERTLRGRVACTGGVIKGSVSIIRGAADFRKFKPGSIIVAANTTPNYVPLLKKCKALICEEGGLTIHAAVISRELGIPCVVGIPDLLFLVKDGDRVEVDAEKGIVKKL